MHSDFICHKLHFTKYHKFHKLNTFMAKNVRYYSTTREKSRTLNKNR